MSTGFAGRRQRPKSKNIKALRRLFSFILPYKHWLIGGGIAFLVSSVISLAMPYLLGRILDILSGAIETNTNIIFAFAFIGAVLMAVSGAFRLLFIGRLSFLVIADLREAVFSKMIVQSRAFFDEIQTGEILSRLSADVGLLGGIAGVVLQGILRNGLVAIGGIAMMFITSVKLTLISMVIVPLMVFAIAVVGRKTSQFTRQSQDAVADATALANEALQGVSTVQSYNQEARIDDIYDGYVETSMRAHFNRINFQAGLNSFLIFGMFVGIIAVLYVGTMDVQNGLYTAGDLVQFIIYAVVVGGSVQALSNMWVELMLAAGASERLIELFDAPIAIKDGENSFPAGDVSPLLRFDDVTFSYPSRPDDKALRDLSFEIREGETLALVGPSGAGKSTIFQLILRFYDPSAGQVLAKGAALPTLKLSDIRGQFAYVSQEPVIFAMSVYENILFARPDATKDEVLAAAKSAYAHEFIEALPDGYDSFVGERGVRLSGGQKARLALARAFLSHAPVLLLDEATAALDAESEHAVQSAVEQLAAQKTVIVVAHRLATVKRADRILVFDGGEIVDEGTHEALVEKDGLYARLARLQFLS